MNLNFLKLNFKKKKISMVSHGALKNHSDSAFVEGINLYFDILTNKIT